MKLRRALYLVSAAVLLSGAISAILIYRAAANNASDDSGYEIAGGFVYPGGGAYDKKYMHDLQLYGGKAAVLADEFMRWFYGLWRGTSLAYTVGVIAVLISFIIFIIAKNLHIFEIKDESGIE